MTYQEAEAMIGCTVRIKYKGNNERVGVIISATPRVVYFSVFDVCDEQKVQSYERRPKVVKKLLSVSDEPEFDIRIKDIENIESCI
jgi:hypothetical protein